MKLLNLLLLACAAGVPVLAQLSAPNDSGVAMGHIHLVVRDVDAQKAFWVAVGGVPVTNGRLQLIQFPGTFVMLRKGEPTGGTVGSVINHIGFKVPNLAAAAAKWKAAGLKTEPGSNPKQMWVWAPDEIKVEMSEDPTMTVPIASHHIHYFVTAPLEIQAWYAKMFGAIPGKRAQFDAADLPAINLSFTKIDAALPGSKGRAVDHVGFEVKNLEAFLKKLEAAGVKIDSPYRRLPDSNTAIAFLTDPWGTYIELTENLAPARME
ncbi:MAG: Glyoxalase/bleomycin resistance protein/dioxygenase [Candidatus Solibacter sp.]|jgi:catechol 2,3-dioxygenase-like lactoylglutathione lyase family enzyme|nr:Glyoxalase/bleomycin resistance protein/dioxygenase [Candidatus Solibacter sp.]